MRKELIDPALFGLPESTMIQKNSDFHYSIVIIKEKLVQKEDSADILDSVRKISSKKPGIQISITTTAAIDSNFIKHLHSFGIEINGFI